MKLLHLNVSNWDVSNVQDMSYLFYGCENLSELNLITNRKAKIIKNKEF